MQQWFVIFQYSSGAGLDFLALPSATAEKQDAGRGDRALCDDDGDIRAVSPHVSVDGQKISERNLQEPEAKEIDYGRRYRIASAIKRLQHDHAIGVPDIAVTEDAQTSRSQGHDLRVLRE